MASYTISPIWGAGAQLFDNSGNVLSGGKIYTYAAGTTTPATTYTTPIGSIANSNPIIVNAAGRLTNEIWLPVSGAYKFVLKDANDVLIATYDNIPTTPQPPIVNDASSISYETGYIVDAGNFTVGATYLITSVGTTDFVAIGAAANVTGILFTATGVGSGTGTAEYSRTVQSKLREVVSVEDFGAVGDGATDDTAAIQKALDYANAQGGTVIHIPSGTYFCTGNLDIYAGTTLFGDGTTNSILTFNHTGDGINSTFPINSSSAANVTVKNLKIVNTNLSNSGGGFVNVCGSYVNIINCFFRGWKYQVIFDQTEISNIDLCEFIAGDNCVGVWLVNGPDHTPGALKNYTNKINITRNQFNATADCIANILDDGGTNHSIENNNFNAGQIGVRASGAYALIIAGNESEVHGTCDISLVDTTYSGTYVGPSTGINITANTLISGGGANISIQNAIYGSIINNVFGQASAGIAFINGNSNNSTGLIIEGNYKAPYTGYGSTAPIFVSSFTKSINQNIIRQTACTYSSSSALSGTVTITPATMEFIYIGTKLTLVNSDGTNGEQVTVTETTGSTFTAILATTKSANFNIFGATPANQLEGLWTPVLYGLSTAGTNTYSTQSGSYSKNGNVVTFSCEINVSAKDAAMAGALFIGGLPYAIKPNSTFIFMAAFNGFTLSAGLTNIYAVSNGTTNLQLTCCGSGVSATTVDASKIVGTTCSIVFSGQYLTNSWE